jgi:hypothetical protein
MGNEHIESAFSEEFKKQLKDDGFYQYYIYRPHTDPVKLAMGVHPTGVPFKRVDFENKTFYEIEGALWEKNSPSVDSKGIFVPFFRMKDEFKGF